MATKMTQIPSEDTQFYPSGFRNHPQRGSIDEQLVQEVREAAAQMDIAKLKALHDYATMSTQPPNAGEITKTATAVGDKANWDHARPHTPRSFQDYTGQSFEYLAAFKDLVDWCNAQQTMIDATYKDDRARHRMHSAVLRNGFAALLKGEGL